MNKKFKLTLVALLFLLLPFKPFAQQPYRQYADDGIMLNFFEIGNPDLRLYLLYNIGLDDRFSLLAEDEYGQFIVNPSEDHFDGNFFETENEYTISVYHRPFGDRYDHLIAVEQIDFSQD